MRLWRHWNLALCWWGCKMCCSSWDSSVVPQKLKQTRGERAIEDGMFRWHHQLSGGVWANSRRSCRTEEPTCCHPWSRKELDMTEQLNNNEMNEILLLDISSKESKAGLIFSDEENELETGIFVRRQWIQTHTHTQHRKNYIPETLII